MSQPIFIGVAWPYVNGDLHVGHLAGYLLPADIFARAQRLMGHKVLMVSGSDCFGTPITVEADKKKTSPAQIVAQYHQHDVHLFKDLLNLSYDIYTQTLTDHHIKIVQEFFLKLMAHGFIFIDKSLQYYSPADQRFLPDRYVIGQCPHCGLKDARSDQCDNCGRVLGQGELINPLSNLSKQPVELKETQHYFLDWPKLQPQIEKYVQQSSPAWKEWVRAETLGWLKEGLKPRAITRDLDWGVPIPTDRLPQDKQIDHADTKRIYVWFDAVIGYYSGSLLWAQEQHQDANLFWQNPQARHYYFMGKDNLIFHTIFWPGQLMGLQENLHLPDFPSINMFFDLEGKKFSKSRGVIIEIKDLVEKFGNDRVRYYITQVMPETKDSSFSWTDFKDKVNNVLVGNLGNFIHRVLSISFAQQFSMPSSPTILPEVSSQIQTAWLDAQKYLNNCEFKNYLETLIKLSSFGNKICETETIWDLNKRDPSRFQVILSNLSLIISSLGYLMTPLMPNASEKLLKMLMGDNFDLSPVTWPEQCTESFLLSLAPQKLANKPQPLFSKIEASDLESWTTKP